jgi:hypothetical protein
MAFDFTRLQTRQAKMKVSKPAGVGTLCHHAQRVTGEAASSGLRRVMAHLPRWPCRREAPLQAGFSATSRHLRTLTGAREPGYP